MPPKKQVGKAGKPAASKAPAKAPAKGKRKVEVVSESETSDAESSTFESQDSSFESAAESVFESEADEFVDDKEPLDLDEKKEEVYDSTDEEPIAVADPDEFNSQSERVLERRSIPILTDYERARVIGQRAAQLAAGAKPLVRGTESLDPQQIAELELRKGVCPFYIKRPLPNNKYEVFHVNELELLD